MLGEGNRTRYHLDNVEPVGRRYTVEDENPYQAPATPEAPRRKRSSVARLASAGVCFLVAAMLCCSPIYSPIYEGLTHLNAYGIHRTLNTRSGLGALLNLTWGCVNVVSCSLIGIGLLRTHKRLTAIGGCTLVLSTAFYVFAYTVF